MNSKEFFYFKKNELDNHFNKNLNFEEFRNTFIFCQSLNEMKKWHFLKNLNNLIVSQYFGKPIIRSVLSSIENISIST
jgi:hypothetical protein